MNNSSNSSNVVWNMNYSNTISSNIANSVQFEYIIKRCRTCNHAHAQEGAAGCYDVAGNSVAFVISCRCKEHVPKDNLEYLEYKLKQKESL